VVHAESVTQNDLHAAELELQSFVSAPCERWCKGNIECIRQCQRTANAEIRKFIGGINPAATSQGKLRQLVESFKREFQSRGNKSATGSSPG